MAMNLKIVLLQVCIYDFLSLKSQLKGKEVITILNYKFHFFFQYDCQNVDISAKI